MTKIAILPYENARNALQEALGADPSQVEGVADLIRDEVAARGTCPRAATIRRVRRFAAPGIELDESLIADVCDLLEREGDVVVGHGGTLSGTPLRAVDLGQGKFRMAGSLSTRRLASHVAGTWDVVGTSRTCQVDDPERAKGAVAAAGGVVLTPSVWACLDRVPPADQRWIDGLDRRLKAEPEAPGSLERDEPLSWYGCVPVSDGIRWKANESGKAARLWRSRNRWGYWHFAWTQHGSPRTAPFVSLRSDDGTRSAFAVAHVLGVPIEVSIEKHDHEAVLSVPHWLPVAEYRFLAVSASLSTAERNCSRWTMPLDRVTSVLALLRKRLGLVVHEEGTR